MAGKPPRETLLWALERFDAEGLLDSADDDPPPPPLAIDLGCGEGRDTAELLRRGWRVQAIDDAPGGLRRLTERDDLVHRERLETRLEGFEGLTLPSASLVSASFSLPFCPPGAFGGLWEQIAGAIPSGGRFAGQFFGDRDGWAALPDRSHHSRDEVMGLFDSFLIERFEEGERDGEDAEGNKKHWHVFHVLARKR